jgi:CRP/FNR family transcriptional regulator
MNDIKKLSPLKTNCTTCSLHDICLPIGMNKNEIGELDEIINRSKPINKGLYIYHSGDDFKSLYAIKTGSVKTYSVSADGDEQITGFYLPGELLGLDSINDNKHPCTAKTLETTSLCEIPFANLEDIVVQIPGLGRQLMRIMSRELKHEDQALGLLVNKSAEVRLASFILNLAQRYKERGYSSIEFNLSMSRNDIANYLGLAVETVSRLFTRFQNENYISAARKQITILDYHGLCGVAGKNRQPSSILTNV